MFEPLGFLDRLLTAQCNVCGCTERDPCYVHAAARPLAFRRAEPGPPAAAEPP